MSDLLIPTPPDAIDDILINPDTGEIEEMPAVVGGADVARLASWYWYAAEQVKTWEATKARLSAVIQSKIDGDVTALDPVRQDSAFDVRHVKPRRTVIDHRGIVAAAREGMLSRIDMAELLANAKLKAPTSRDATYSEAMRLWLASFVDDQPGRPYIVVSIKKRGR